MDVALWFLRTHHDFDGDLMFCADIKEENSGKRQLTFENLDRNRFFLAKRIILLQPLKGGVALCKPQINIVAFNRSFRSKIEEKKSVRNRWENKE